MTIGDKIKSLRKEKGITQEKLAAYLNITYQSVSKWENNTALPDLSLVVPLASFFGVTTDELLGMDSKKEQEIRACDAESQALMTNGQVSANLDLWRAAARKYPNDYHCLQAFANALLMYCIAFDGAHNDEANEGIAICNRILEDCTDTDIRVSTLNTLTYLYSHIGDDAMAVSTAQKAPDLYCSQQVLLEGAYRYGSAAYIEAKERNAQSYLDLLHNTVLYTARDDNAETIRACEALLTVWDAMFYDGNFLFYHIRLQELCLTLARAYAREQNKCKTLACLERAKAHAVQSDRLPDDQTPYTGLFRHIFYKKAQTSKSSAKSNTELFGELLGEKCFDFVRSEEAFRAL